MKIYGLIRTAMYWALTALVLVFTALSTLAEEIEVLRYFIGGLMVFYGVEEIILTAIKHKKHYAIRALYWNIAEILIGLTLIVFVETGEIEEVAYAVVCASWAIWSILREVRELIEVTEELKENKYIHGKIVAVFNLLESLTVIALSLTMLIEPGEHHAKMHLYLLAVELFTKVLFPIVNDIAERIVKRRSAKRGQVEPEGEIAPPPEEQKLAEMPQEEPVSADTPQENPINEERKD